MQTDMPATAESNLHRQPSIMVVDDDPRYLELLSFMLEGEGFRVTSSIDPRQAAGLAVSERPDLILTDLSMPEMDGLELAVVLKSDPRTADIPLVFFTARSREADRHEALSIGAVEYLVKPIGINELMERVQRVLQSLKRPEDEHEHC